MTNDGAELIFVTGPGCPHCAAIKRVLAELATEGVLAEHGWALQEFDVAEHEEELETLAIRSVPWLSVGGLILVGAHSKGELLDWLTGKLDARDYVEQRLAAGERGLVLQSLKTSPVHLPKALALFADPDAKLDQRLGLSAVIEEWLAESPGDIEALLPELVDLSRSEHPAARADACYFLGLSGVPAARAELDRCLRDSDAEVREIAAEALDDLSQRSSG